VELRVGTDVESISEIESSLRQYGERYASRLYTQHELECCGGIGPQAAPGLTARFAAKEAAIKVLRPVADIPRWEDGSSWRLVKKRKKWQLPRAYSSSP
jgi:holo-[acyl-carrier protein] synthase